MTKVIGSQADVPDIGDPIVSPWHQDTAKKIVHVFASTAARDAWVSPPNGAVCQAPAGAWYHRVGGVWVAFPTRMGGTWRRAAAQSVANTTATGITLDTEDNDTHGFGAPGSGTLTVPAGCDGVYAVNASMYTGGEGGIVYLVGTGVVGSPTGRANAFNAWATITHVAALTAGQTIGVAVWQNSGAAQNVTGRVSMYRLTP